MGGSDMISLDTTSDISLYEQLYQQLRDDIAAGRLQKGTRLKPLRELEFDLKVSRTTVSRAYQQLISEGYVRSCQGSGYYVEDIGPTIFEGRHPIPQKPIISEVLKEFDFDFSPNFTEPSLFPWKIWRKALEAAVDRDSFGSNKRLVSSKGTWCLRESLSRFLYHHRGVRCVPEQLVVCTDSHRATDVLLSLLDNSTYRFAFEDPGVTSMRNLVQEYGFDVYSIPTLDERSFKILETANCNAVFTMPSCQLPMGTTMSLRVRNLLLRWASLNDAYIVEYDHHARFQGYGNVEVPAVQSLDKFQNVVYIGTLSEMLPPTLSLAYLVLPSNLLSRYEERYSASPPMLPEFYEQAFADILEDGTFSRYVRKVEASNKRKLDSIVSCIEEDMPSEVSLVNARAGYAIVKIRASYGREELIGRLEDGGIRIYSIYDACHERCTSWDDLFVMGFASLDEDGVERGCKQMASEIALLMRGKQPASSIESADAFRKELRKAVVEMERDEAVQIVREAVRDGTGTLADIEDGLSTGMQRIGNMFDNGEIGICDLMEAADVLAAAFKELTLIMSEKDRKASNMGTVVMYTVEGDLHDLGKRIIRVLLEANGFTVHDLGCDTAPEKVLAKAQEVAASIIMGSAQMTTTMPAQKDLIALLQTEGVRDDYYVMFGGGPVTAEWVQSIGGDAYTDTATDAVIVAKQYEASLRR